MTISITNDSDIQTQTNRRLRNTLLGVALFLAMWQVMSIFVADIIIASPVDTILSLTRLAFTADFWHALGITLKRFGLSLLCGALTGFGLGLLAGLKPIIKSILEPMRWALMSVPPVVLVTIGMIWFGMGSIQTIFVTSLLIIPIMYVNTIEGVDGVDKTLLEMGRVHKAGWLLLLKEIYLPGIGGPVLAGLALSAGFGIRIVVLAEVLGAYTGVGYEFSLARTNLETPTLFAWIAVCLLLVGAFEFGVLSPAKGYIMRWKKEQG